MAKRIYGFALSLFLLIKRPPSEEELANYQRYLLEEREARLLMFLQGYFEETYPDKRRSKRREAATGYG